MKKRIDPNEERKRRRERVLEVYRACGSIKATARRLRISINTVRKVLRGKEEQKRPISKQPPRPSKLDPFRPIIQRLVLEDKLTVVLVLEEIRALGYTGGHSILREYIRTIRPEPKTRVTTVVEHPPGAEGQVDWPPYTVTIGGEQRVVHAFSLILPFSRDMVVRFALDETLETLLPLHDEAFTLIGGIPSLMTYDNMTTVGRHIGPDKIWINPSFEPYMKTCGFDIHLIAPGCPNQHGSVERPFSYIENNCRRRRRFRFDSFEDLQQHTIWWCNEVANVRPHGTTRERPVDRLVRERPLLLALPWQRPEPYRDLGRKVSVQYFRATKLLAALYASLADSSTDKLVARLARVDLLIIDDIRHLPPHPEHASLLYDVVEARHQKKATMVSSNLNVEEWGTALGNPKLTASLVDRLMERAHIINIKRGKSYRTHGPEAPPAADQPRGIAEEPERAE